MFKPGVDVIMTSIGTINKLKNPIVKLLFINYLKEKIIEPSKYDSQGSI
jgi:hypothetical protein